MSPRPRVYATAAERQRAYRQRCALRNANRHALAPGYADNWVTIYVGDCLAVLATLPAASVDLIVTSPPYNVGIEYSSYADLRPLDEYVAWLTDVARALARVARPGCRLAWNCPLDVSKPVRRFTVADHVGALERAGWTYRSTILWDKMAVTGYPTGSKVNPYVLTPVEAILLFYKETWQRDAPARASDLTNKEFQEWTNSPWRIVGAQDRQTGHPVAFPYELARRLVKLLSLPGDVVLDPFLGSGTTARAAKDHGRRCLGIELDPGYAARAADRCRQELLFLPHRVPLDELAPAAGGER